ncbi:hypothetical protein CEE36_02065 [candidate division TA06 bacterium B3_TA06]|uniref:Uncharacterized protein n=1 Tax=candidate division TA06 bacterium B3_TA06 TaxID=2012487 RepID=A0A532V9Q2_UNCT6|nr:MAG: hypothetical protein CEE36_02065 [candidate division TA06 bacterium B3_TA06]
MSGITPLIEASLGPWLAITVGALWLVFLILLAVHVVKRRSGYYRRYSDKKPPSRAILWAIDGLLFLLVCLLGFLAVRFFSTTSFSWYFRIGILSGVFAVIVILIILRQDLALRIAAAKEAPSTAEKDNSRLKKALKR